MMKFILCWVILLLSSEVQGATWQITFPRPPVTSTSIEEYPLQVLSLALAETGVNFQLIPSIKVLPKSKALARLKDNREINIIWGMTSAQREQDFLPIRIPIFKGLGGWRLFLIRSDMSARFQYIQNLEQLVKLAPLQGRDWQDTKILQSNGFDVVVDRNQTDLLQMLARAQGDFFPRSIAEIWEELGKSPVDYELKIQPNLGLYYPSAIYFFVNKRSAPLAKLIETGLEKAIANGKFDALFKENYQDYIQKADIKNRTFYPLENNFLPPKTPLARKELWFDGELTPAQNQ
jgi:hypothetical protein